MKKQFYITIELDTAQPEAIATVMNFDIQGCFASDDLLRQHRFDITPSYFKLNYSYMSSILSDMLRNLANHIDDLAANEFLGISEEGAE